MSRFIHLLYVPTMNCNMSCRYCYLGENTVELRSDKGYLETLRFAVDKLRAADVIPFNISLHGGEVTTLAPDNFRELVAYISDYYARNASLLEQNGFKVGRPHIKTNLLSLHRHIDALRDYDVSISGSLDLPLSLHDAYRVTKGGKGTLETILRNVDALAALPNRKKVSATIFKEHFDRLDEIPRDIRYLHEHTCLDMNDFNFMIGFEPQSQGEVKLTALPEEDQLALYERMKAEFTGTDLEPGLRGPWFAEFTPAYCTNCDNCGDKFFLLEKNGDIYSCVRGQGNPDFFYGNIYRDEVETILATAHTKIFLAHNRQGLDPECAACEHLHLCKTGCPFVKTVYHSPKSYTCLLQKALYRDFPYPEKPFNFAYRYASLNHPGKAEALFIHQYGENSLPGLIDRDPKLQKVYDPNAFILEVDGVDHPLESQLLRRRRDLVFILPGTSVHLYVRKDVLDALSDYPVNNALYMMLLSGDTVVYGDEQREKQEHIMTHQVFKRTLAAQPSPREGFYCLDLMPLLALYGDALSRSKPNNFFFTTTDLRDYHYTKQKNNGYYHHEAMNLPFPNVELFYLNPTELEAIIHEQQDRD